MLVSKSSALNNCVFLSVYSSALLACDNIFNHKEALAYLDNKDIDYKIASGGYTMTSGLLVTEQTIIFNPKDMDCLLYLADKYKQESIMIVGECGTASILFLSCNDGDKGNVAEWIGTIHKVSRETARSSKGFTMLHGEYYTAIKTDKTDKVMYELCPNCDEETAINDLNGSTCYYCNTNIKNCSICLNRHGNCTKDTGYILDLSIF